MVWIPIVLSLTLGLIALLHGAWALGSPWPMKNDRDLSQTVVGDPGRTVMPQKWQSALVALCLMGAALWPFVMLHAIAIPLLPEPLIPLGAYALIFIFLGRGAVGLTPWFKRLLPGDPFVRYNRIYYSPLCLLIGIGFVALLPNIKFTLPLY
ncbi:DUF3995 domain-containing protein [Parvibaculum lavamentivorans]|nr:DUF3995 domain-containing protein [Parvibaculum lavamentivorans]